jgi:alkylation response protein AidB-like acyl-CoA dehydrogenase
MGEVRRRAEALLPVIAAHAEWGEAAGRQHDEVFTAFGRSELTKLFLPADYGGFEADPLTAIDALDCVAAENASAAWALMISAEEAGYAAGYVPAATMVALFNRQPHLLMAGSGNPHARARPAEGGVQVSGRWPFGSGVHGADYWFGQCLLDGVRTDPPTLCATVIPAGQVRILDTWHVAGMRGTGSNDVEAEGVFVPDGWHRRYVMGEPAIPDTPYFRLPVRCRFPFPKVGVALGIAGAALTAFEDLAGAKTPVGDRSLLRERPRAQQAIAQATARRSAARAYVFEVMGRAWDMACERHPVDARTHAEVRLACSWAVQACVEAVDLLHAAAGATANFDTSPLSRQFRDVHVLPQQIMVTPQAIDTAGRVLLGLDPDSSTF